MDLQAYKNWIFVIFSFLPFFFLLPSNWMCVSEIREEENWAACFALVFTMSHNNSLVLLETFVVGE